MRDTGNRHKRIFAGLLDLVIFILTVGAWFWMLLFTTDEAFASVGIESLKYYTVLSNLFTGFVFGACALYRLIGRMSKLPLLLQLLKLTASSCVAITFTVVMVFLGPVFGFDLMFQSFNLIFHLIAPVLACVSYLVFEKRGRITLKYSAFGLIPTFLYGSVYMLNVMINGTEGNDIYYFTYWGIPIGLVFFVVILALNFAFIQLMRRFSEK